MSSSTDLLRLSFEREVQRERLVIPKSVLLLQTVNYLFIYKVREGKHEEKAWISCVVHALSKTKGK